MNWRFGGKDESNRQAAERNARAARKTLAEQQQLLNILSSDKDDEYRDCDTSLIFGNVDGADDGDDDTMSADELAAELARQRALPVEDADFENDAESWKKEIKLKFEPHDIVYWFNSIESQMKKHCINRQWDKKDAIIPCLPEEVIEECKPILRLTQADAGNNIYKTLKKEIISLFSPREEDAFKKSNLPQIDRPSKRIR